MTRLEVTYFKWLILQINIRNSRTYIDVCDRLHNTEFVWIVPNDNNRVQDGVDLRNEFSQNKMLMADKGGSVLEVLIGLSRRVAFVAGGVAEDWAWQLMENLELNKVPDPFTDDKANKVEDILETLIWRTYKRDGQGGFFPLLEPKENQTQIEIWYQMNAYVQEIQEQ